jgi:LmbE family N-acetylglucosaminyl deacetylase
MIELTIPAGDLSVLCLGAHPDDIELGCGGTLLAMAEARPAHVRAVILTGGPERHDEARNAFPTFCPGADVVLHQLPDGRLPAHWDATKQTLEDVARAAAQPDLIFAPRRDDAHQDHRLIAEIVPTVWRDSLILGYEIPKWDGDFGRVTHYVPVRTDVALRKAELLDRYFPSQHDRRWWSQETFLSVMRLRGIECGYRYAEGFVVEKAVLDFLEVIPDNVSSMISDENGRRE